MGFVAKVLAESAHLSEEVVSRPTTDLLVGERRSS